MGLKEKVLLSLVEDSKQSDTEIAKKLGCAQSTVFRIRKQLEREHAIWGYSAVIDWSKLGYVLYAMILRIKPPTKEGVDLVVKGLKAELAKQYDVLLLDVLFMFGEFEWLVLFAAPNDASAQQYVSYVRDRYKAFIEARPRVSKLLFPLKWHNKFAPNLGDLKKLAVDHGGEK